MIDPRIIIVGPGIVGACLAYEASQRGLCPTAVSAGGVAAAGSASAASWGWINACSTYDPSYFRLRYPVDLIDGVALPACLPRLCEIPKVALHTAVKGAVESGPTTTVRLEAYGAQMLTAHVHALLSDGGRIFGVMTEDGPVHANEVILAAGNATARLLDTVSVPLQMQSSDGLLMLSDPVDPFLSAVVAGSDFHVRQREDGRLLVGYTFGACRPRPGNDSLADYAADQLARIGEVFDLPSTPSVESFTLGTRPIPRGGMPCIGRCARPGGGDYEGLYVVVMHSGVTNGAGVAHAAMDEILDGIAAAEIAPFRMPRRESGAA